MLRQNLSVISGNLVAPAETRNLNGGKSVTRFRIAHNHRRRDWTSYFDVEAWNGVGKSCTDLPIGTLVEVTGELAQDRWDKDGKKGAAVKLTAQSVDFVSFPKKNQDQQ